jgi:hypothetical protein
MMMLMMMMMMMMTTAMVIIIVIVIIIIIIIMVMWWWWNEAMSKWMLLAWVDLLHELLKFDYLFLVYLMAMSITECMVSNDWIILKNEFETMWNAVVVI